MPVDFARTAGGMVDLVSAPVNSLMQSRDNAEQNVRRNALLDEARRRTDIAEQRTQMQWDQGQQDRQKAEAHAQHVEQAKYLFPLMQQGNPLAYQAAQKMIFSAPDFPEDLRQSIAQAPPEQQKAYFDRVIGRVAGAQEEPGKLPTSVQEYQYGQKDPGYNAWLASRKPEAASVKVQLGPQETEENKVVGKSMGEMYVDTQKAGNAATGKIANLDRLSTLLKGIETGKLTPAATVVAGYGRSLGIEIDPNLDAKQAAQALTNAMALEMRNPSGGAGMPGAMSDADRVFLLQTVPNLSNTPGGNALIIDTGKKLAERDQQVAKMAREYRIKHGQLDDGFYQELQQFSEANPLFGGSKASDHPPEVQAVLDRYK